MEPILGETFWPSSKYGAITRQARLTKIVLLAGHSLVSLSMVRRHRASNDTCPLWNNATWIPEHMIFESIELKDDRGEAHKR